MKSLPFRGLLLRYVEKIMKHTIITMVLLALISCSSSNSNEIPVTQASIELKSLPASITYAYSAPINGVGFSEYSWEIYFDLNNDSVINKGDAYVSLQTYRWDDTPLTTINVSDIQARLWAVEDGSTSLATIIDDISHLTNGNSITFQFDTSKYNLLAGLSNGTQIYVHTIYKVMDTGHLRHDYYPEKDTYTSGLDTSSLQDITNDFESNLGPVIGEDYPLIDIVGIRINVQ